MPRHYEFRPVTYPGKQTYRSSDFLVRLISEADSAFQSLIEIPREHLINSIRNNALKNQNFHNMIHKVCSKYCTPVEVIAILTETEKSRTILELEAFDFSLKETYKLPICSYSWFIGYLENICSFFNPDNYKIRRKFNVGSGPDELGENCLYLPHQIVLSELKKLHEFIRSNWNQPSPYLAPIVLGALLTIHPFRDGNGRVRRTLYNLLLNKNNLSQSHTYLPLKHFFTISNKSLELNIREANISSRWSPLLAYMAALTVLTASLFESKYLFKSVLQRFV